MEKTPTEFTVNAVLYWDELSGIWVESFLLFFKQNGKLRRKTTCHRKGTISALPNTRDSYLPCHSPGGVLLSLITQQRHLQLYAEIKFAFSCSPRLHEDWNQAADVPPSSTSRWHHPRRDSTSSNTRKHQPPFMTGFSYILSLCSVSSIKVQVTRLLSCGQVSTSRP